PVAHRSPLSTSALRQNVRGSCPPSPPCIRTRPQYIRPETERTLLISTPRSSLHRPARLDGSRPSVKPQPFSPTPERKASAVSLRRQRKGPRQPVGSSELLRRAIRRPLAFRSPSRQD